MKKEVFLLFLMIVTFECDALVQKDSVQRYGIGLDFAHVKANLFGIERQYGFGTGVYYQIKPKLNAHVSFYYSEINSRDYFRRNTYKEISYTIKFGPEISIKLWKAQYQPRLLMNINFALVSMRQTGDYLIENPYWNGRKTGGYVYPFATKYFLDGGLGLQFEYKRFRLKSLVSVLPYSKRPQFFYEDSIASKSRYLSFQLPSYWYSAFSLNTFLYYRF